MRHASVFSGIGAFEIAAEWMGWTNTFHCEVNPFARKVLQYYWPNSTSYENIKQTDFTSQRGKIDVLTGGFPCQPFSSAGKRRGAQDHRYLWPQMLRTVREIKPDWVVCENVAELTRMALEPRLTSVEIETLVEGKDIYRTLESEAIIERICQDLEKENYQVQTFLIPACSTNAPHRRDRTFIIASYTTCERLSRSEKARDNQQKKENKREKPSRFLRPTWENFPVESPLYRGDDGLSARLSGITFSRFRKEAIKAYGNAVVPGLAYEIFQAIQKTEDEYSNKII